MNILVYFDRLAGWWLDWRTEWSVEHNPLFEDWKLRKLEANGIGGFDVSMISPAIAILADEAAKTLNAAKAENYIEFDLLPRLDRGLKAVRVTLQWAGKFSPAQKAHLLELENAALREQIEKLRNDEN
jgi:hypothetical protein